MRLAVLRTPEPGRKQACLSVLDGVEDRICSDCEGD